VTSVGPTVDRGSGGGGGPSRAEDSAKRTAREFAAALNAGEPDAAAALFASRGRMLTADRTEVSGRAAVRDLLTQIVESRIQLEVRLGRTLVAGDIALSTQYWRRRLPAGTKDPGYDQASVANVVLGLSGERWEIVIVSPWG
jgi:uncharacterized protein (TIGR02246 family)